MNDLNKQYIQSADLDDKLQQAIKKSNSKISNELREIRKALG